MSKVYYLLFTFFGLSCAIVTERTDVNSYSKSNSHILEFYGDTLYMPRIDSSEIFISHFAYDLAYNELHEQAKWVFYKLDSSRINGPISRTDKFKIDPLIVTVSANHNDYRGSGFDRGHLAPAGDMTWSLQAMNESFYYSNMSPQVPSFNRGIWRKLESKVRSWVTDFDSIYVTTGPVLELNLSSIGEGVSVPKYFYKSLVGFRDSRALSIAFVLPNEGSQKELQEFVISVDSLENLTGIDFNSKLHSNLQSPLENSVCMNCWKW